MRLHDIQVTLSSADIANRYQIHHQQLAQQAQAQETVNSEARAKARESQARQAAEEQASKEITEGDKRLKQWNKGGRQDENRKKDDQSASDQKLPGNKGGIIDIKA
jgi:hypothetical protein